jgi:hypothetical protein
MDTLARRSSYTQISSLANTNARYLEWIPETPYLSLFDGRCIKPLRFKLGSKALPTGLLIFPSTGRIGGYNTPYIENLGKPGGGWTITPIGS